MTSWKNGLRAKSMLAFALACLLALVPAAVIGWQVLDGARNYFGENYVRNLTQLKRQSILAPVARDLALSLRLANSVLTRQWLKDETHPDKKALLFQEAEGYRQDFHDHAYFFASAKSRHFYFNDNLKPLSDQPRYTVDPANASGAWFTSTLTNADHTGYNINVNDDIGLQTTKVWINVLVHEGGQALGVAGTGLDLSSFVKEFITTRETGVTPIIVNAAGAIQAHPDRALIAIDTASVAPSLSQTLAGQLPEGAQRAALGAAMAQAQALPGSVNTLRATLGGKAQQLALVYMPELKWYVVIAVDLKAAQIIDQSWLNTVVVALLVVLAVLLLGFGYTVEKLVLQPVRYLQRSALALAQGDFSVSLPPPSRDELGDLSRAFASMASQIRSNTEELEHKVQTRTQALEEAGRHIERAYRQINDSIDYASLIQRAILPSEPMHQKLGSQLGVLWQPRDVVGGDFYIFRADGQCYLIGVIDCAGHGVAGALMTMLARSALDLAIGVVGIASPAAILSHFDATMRGLLQQGNMPRAIATSMDAGLVWVDPGNRTMRYAGAKISLYQCDGQAVKEIKSARRAIGDRRPASYLDADITAQTGVSYYLTTDGFLDQAGGDLGYGLGNTRFAQWLLQHAHLSAAQQASALEAALQTYRGSYPQRDDITLVCLKMEATAADTTTDTATNNPVTSPALPPEPPPTR